MTKKFTEILSDYTYSLQNNVPKVFSGFCLRDSVDDSIKVICVTTGDLNFRLVFLVVFNAKIL